MRRIFQLISAAALLSLSACATEREPPMPHFNTGGPVLNRCVKAGGRCVNTFNQRAEAPPWPCGERYHAVDDVQIVLEDGSIEHGAGCLSEAAGEERCCLPDR